MSCILTDDEIQWHRNTLRRNLHGSRDRQGFIWTYLEGRHHLTPVCPSVGLAPRPAAPGRIGGTP